MRCTFFFISIALAAKHQLFVGNLYWPPTLHAVEFDDVTHEFRKLASQPVAAPHSWLALSHDKKSLYGTSINATSISSYRVTSPSTVELVRTINATGNCFNTTSAFIQGTVVPPYTVISASWPGPLWPAPRGCGMSFAIDAEDSSLTEVLDTWAYTNNSSPHGIDIREVEGNTVVYATDLSADGVWAHSIDKPTGRAATLFHEQTEAKSHPRHLRIHPGGKYLYVLLESANAIIEYRVNEKTGVIVNQTSRWSLLPEERRDENKDYWSAEVMLSKSSRYLWATARAQSNTTFVGYINAFLLDNEGRIAKTMFRVPTTTGGGTANAISPAEFSDEYAVMTNLPRGYVEMFKMEGPKQGKHGLEYTTARPVGKVDINDGGCCANAVWYS
ncbi:Lactonase, 7-bladed beta-propeller-domain-containing protein [Podospora conica]|nr:Lactonase, 7-bladed beta-propeller-domain-containing protein [Schizothecium conicum]